MGTIQTRLTSDNRQHDEAFKKSRQEIYNYNKQVDKSKQSVINFAKSGLGKLGIAFSAAGVAMSAFNTAIKTNQQLADQWGTAMEVAKTSYQHLISSVSGADFSHLISGFRDVTAAAKEAYKAMDAVATQKILSKGKLAEYKAKLTEAKYNVRIGKGTSAEVKYWEGKFEEELKKMLPLLQTEIQTKIDKYVGWNTAKSGAIPYGYQGIIEWAQKGEEAISKEINDLQRQLDNTSRMTQAWLWQQLDNKIRVLQAVRRRLTDGENLDDVMSSIESYWNLNESIYQTKLGDTRYTNTKTSSKSTSKPKEREKIEVPLKIYSEEADLIAGIYTTISEANKKILDEQLNTIPALEGHIELNEELASLYAKENDLLEEQHEILSLQTSSISSLGSAFSNLGDAFDSTELKAAGIITQAIATIIEGYTKAMSSWAATASPWAWIGFSAAGLATLTSVISQIHSLSGFADGGIVGGNSFSGDRVMARVNSGEMILNRSQQANLFNMIGGGVTTGGNVKFRIEGDALVGVLNNYNKKTGRVR